MANNAEVVSALEKRVRQLIAGFTNVWPATVNVNVSGQLIGVQQVISQLEVILTVLQQVRDAQAAAHQAVVNRQSQSQGWHVLIESLVQSVKAQLGLRSPILQQFGIAPKHSGTKLTVDQKAVAKARRQATRQVRGTRGKKQRSLIVPGGQPTVQILGSDGKPIGEPPQGGTLGGGGNGSGK
ncbi:MAG: hypothetical protein ACYCWW_17985 [Deltaproteobacteria bacterium]